MESFTIRLTWDGDEDGYVLFEPAVGGCPVRHGDSLLIVAWPRRPDETPLVDDPNDPLDISVGAGGMTIWVRPDFFIRVWNEAAGEEVDVGPLGE